jgi:hypothetical protein
MRPTTVQDILDAHAQFGRLDREKVKEALGTNWPAHWDSIGPGEGIFAPLPPFMNPKTKWEARSALRWGSEHKGWFGSMAAAKAFAQAEIKKHGNVGKIGLIDRDTNTVYFDVHEEMT